MENDDDEPYMDALLHWDLQWLKQSLHKFVQFVTTGRPIGPSRGLLDGLAVRGVCFVKSNFRSQINSVLGSWHVPCFRLRARIDPSSRSTRTEREVHLRERTCLSHCLRSGPGVHVGLGLSGRLQARCRIATGRECACFPNGHRVLRLRSRRPGQIHSSKTLRIVPHTPAGERAGKEPHAIKIKIRSVPTHRPDKKPKLGLGGGAGMLEP